MTNPVNQLTLDWVAEYEKNVNATLLMLTASR
jgi:hypothetical protein